MRSIIYLFILLFALASCRHSPVIPETPAMSFAKDVQPIIIANCTASGCHGSIHPKRIQFETYDDVMKLVSPGNALGSSIYQVITGKGLSTLMPPTSSSQGQLTDAQLKVIYLWIMQGAKDN